jgi:hypothetical protein
MPQPYPASNVPELVRTILHQFSTPGHMIVALRSACGSEIGKAGRGRAAAADAVGIVRARRQPSHLPPWSSAGSRTCTPPTPTASCTRRRPFAGSQRAGGSRGRASSAGTRARSGCRRRGSSRSACEGSARSVVASFRGSTRAGFSCPPRMVSRERLRCLSARIPLTQSSAWTSSRSSRLCVVVVSSLRCASLVDVRARPSPPEV